MRDCLNNNLDSLKDEACFPPVSSRVNIVYLFILSEQTDGDDVEIGCPITCGDCKAVLLVKKFVCPGINVKCVKVGIYRSFLLPYAVKFV